MAASHCHCMMKVMVSYFVSDMHKVMTTSILVVFVLAWLQLI
jgi:hypothetical protein